MLSFLPNSARARRLLWRVRWGAGIGARSPREVEFRLAQTMRRRPRDGIFGFPWGTVQYVSAENLLAQYREIFINRQYAFATDSRAPRIVDCGGNIGMSALWFCQNYPSCRLTVLEADPKLCEVMRSNLSAANGTAGLSILGKAAWVADGAVKFDLRGDDKGRIDPAGGRAVPAVDIARLIDSDLDLLKLDVEGAEFDIVEHLCRTGAIARVKRIVAEYHVRGGMRPFSESIGLLCGAGFDVTIGSVLNSDHIGTRALPSSFDAIGSSQMLAEVYAWRVGGTR